MPEFKWSEMCLNHWALLTRLDLSVRITYTRHATASFEVRCHISLTLQFKT